MNTKRNPNSLKNLRQPWRPGESGNPSGSRKRPYTDRLLGLVEQSVRVRPFAASRGIARLTRAPRLSQVFQTVWVSFRVHPEMLPIGAGIGAGTDSIFGLKNSCSSQRRSARAVSWLLSSLFSCLLNLAIYAVL